MYDDRMTQICHAIPVNFDLDVRELVIQTESLEADHEREAGERHSVEELVNIYEIDETLAIPAPDKIAIVDDVLTVGRHFRAMETIISERFPNIPIVGIFVARCISPPIDFGIKPVE